MRVTVPTDKGQKQQLKAQDAAGYARGWHDCEAALAQQRAQLNLDQTKAVTDLLRACHENLSKAGYLIGKLNRDNSR